MKFLSTYVVLFAVTLTDTNAARLAVSPLDGFEQFYFQTKNSRTFEKRSEEESAEVKAGICEAILGSSLFRTRHRCRAYLNVDAVDDELKKNYTRFYQKTRGSNNPYKLLPMSIDGKVAQERVFFCLARLDGSEINLFHVSTDYNVQQRQPRIINGRFIFADDKVIALAEEPASVQENDRKITEESFWNNFYAAYQTKWLSDDKMCQLTALEKIRLCNCVLNSNEYRGRIEFLPEVKNIEPQCLLREISFEYEQILEKDKNADEYKSTPVAEWMIPCKAVQKETQEPLTRYILRGSKATNEFIYYVGMGPEENVTYLESRVGNKKPSANKEDTAKQGKANRGRGTKPENENQEKDDEEDEEEGGQDGFFSSGFGFGGRGGQSHGFEIFL